MTIATICVGSGFLVFYSYALYPVLLSFLAKLFGKLPPFNSEYFPTVAVVVPVYNEEDVINKKIENIFSIDYPADKIKIYFGSDQSSDRTNELVQMCDDSRVTLWVAPKRGGKTEILNQLIPQINDAEVLLLTDANTMHRKDCLKNMVGYFADSSVGVVAGRVIHTLQEGKESSEEMYRSFEVWQKENESLLHSSISAFGGFYAIRRSSFVKIPFNAYSNDDVLIPMNVIRQKQRVLFLNNAISEEDVTGSVEAEFKRRVRIGAGNYQSFFWLLDFLNPFKGWPVFCYISHKVLRWFSALLIGIHVVSLGILALLSENTLIQYGAYAYGILGLVALSYRFVKIPLLRPWYYFIVMNWALFLGFFRYAGGIKSAAWSSTEREKQ